MEIKSNSQNNQGIEGHINRKSTARIRKKLKLTQKEAALITGGGHNAFSRYERGEAKPIQAILNLFKLLDHHPDLLNELKSIRTA
jgi:HTH-type transcriptional regulator / antitoxin MqsA